MYQESPRINIIHTWARFSGKFANVYITHKRQRYMKKTNKTKNKKQTVVYNLHTQLPFTTLQAYFFKIPHYMITEYT